MTDFETRRLPVERDEVAPDGCDVRVLLGLRGRGLMGHYELAPGHISRAVTNQTIEEIWFFLSGSGEMWRKQGEREEIVVVEFGVCVTVPLGTHFQLRSFGPKPLTAMGIVMPCWPGAGEAIVVQGKWEPT